MTQIKYAFSFDISGKMAIFRKVFSNVTSLTYYFPPRTTIMGIVAAAMGFNKDAYYSTLDKLEFGVSILDIPMKLIFSVNELNISSTQMLQLRGKHKSPTAPIRKEFLVPEIGKQSIRYNIIVGGEDENTLIEIKERIRRPVYPLSFGEAQMPAKILSDSISEVNKIGEPTEKDGYISTRYVCKIKERPLMEDEQIFYIEEAVPRKFNDSRRVDTLVNYIFSDKEIKFKAPYEGIFGFDGINICFL